jgi:hypothetical protein
LGKVENRKLGGAEDRLPEGSPKGAASGTMQVKDCQRQPEGRAERERTSQPERSAATSQFRGFFDKINIIKKIEIRRAGAFVERMWLSKKKTSASELASVSLF